MVNSIFSGLKKYKRPDGWEDRSGFDRGFIFSYPEDWSYSIFDYAPIIELSDSESPLLITLFPDYLNINFKTKKNRINFIRTLPIKSAIPPFDYKEISFFGEISSGFIRRYLNKIYFVEYKVLIPEKCIAAMTALVYTRFDILLFSIFTDDDFSDSDKQIVFNILGSVRY